MLTIQDCIDKFQALTSEFELLAYDELMTPTPNPPATEQQVSHFERVLGYRLPEDFRGFLLLHDGWQDFHGEAPIAGINHRQTELFAKAVRVQSESFDQMDEENPIKMGALPILIAHNVDYMLFYFPTGVDAGKYVSYDSIDREEEFDSLNEFFESQLELLREMIEEEKEGVSSEEE